MPVPRPPTGVIAPERGPGVPAPGVPAARYGGSAFLVCKVGDKTAFEAAEGEAVLAAELPYAEAEEVKTLAYFDIAAAAACAVDDDVAAEEDVESWLTTLSNMELGLAFRTVS